MPPVEFERLVDAMLPESQLRSVIHELLERKRNGDELNEAPSITEIDRFLAEEMARLDVVAATVQRKVIGSDEELDGLFRKLVLGRE